MKRTSLFALALLVFAAVAFLATPAQAQSENSLTVGVDPATHALTPALAAAVQATAPAPTALAALDSYTANDGATVNPMRSNSALGVTGRLKCVGVIHAVRFSADQLNRA